MMRPRPVSNGHDSGAVRDKDHRPANTCQHLVQRRNPCIAAELVGLEGRNRQNIVEPAREVSLSMILDMIPQTGNHYYRG